MRADTLVVALVVLVAAAAVVRRIVRAVQRAARAMKAGAGETAPATPREAGAAVSAGQV